MNYRTVKSIRLCCAAAAALDDDDDDDDDTTDFAVGNDGGAITFLGI
jgi:hypothetical protein